jgi:hypothetical protein
VLGRDSALEIRLDRPAAAGAVVRVLRAGDGLRGRFGTVTVKDGEGRTYAAVPDYSSKGLSVRLK